MKPFTVDGMLMDRQELSNRREDLIRLRDAALKASMLDWAFTISVTIAIMHHFISVMES